MVSKRNAVGLSSSPIRGLLAQKKLIEETAHDDASTWVTDNAEAVAVLGFVKTGA